MKRRILGLGLALVCACSALSGCELMDHHLRSKSSDSSKDKEPSEPLVGEVKSEAPAGFFKGTRLSGAMSDEGRDIERSLGVGK